MIVGDGNGDGQVDSHNCDCLFPIPDITVHTTGYRVGRGTISAGPLHVDWVYLDEGKLVIGLSTFGLSMPISVSGYLDPTCVVACATRVVPSATVTGTVSADHIYVDATVGVSLGDDGRPNVTVCPSCLAITVGNPQLDIDWGALEFLDGPLGLSNITTQIVTTFQSYLENAVGAALSDQLPEVLRGIIESFELPATITLPPPTNVVLNVASEFDVIDLHGPQQHGFARLGMAVAVSAANPLLTSPLGSIRRGGDVPTFSATPYALGVGLKDDFLNQFLWATWVGGAFELPTLLGLGCNLPGGADARLSLSLPPVIMPGTNGHEIDIGFGDVYIETVAPTGDATAAGLSSAGNVAVYASMTAGGAITIDADSYQLVLTLEEDPHVAVEIVSAPEGADLDALSAQYGALAECALTRLAVDIVQAIPIPAPPIGSLGVPGVPIDARWVLGDGVLGRQGAYYAVTGNVVVK